LDGGEGVAVRVLALDSSSESGSIALSKGGPDGVRLVAELTVGHVGKHSKWLMESIEGLVKSVKWSPVDIDLLALGLGPGSFTGLRIGVSIVKGLSWAMKRPVVGVSTLKALSMNVRYSDITVCPLLDARKGEVYTALYRRRGGGMEALMPDCALKPEELIERVLEKGTGPVVFLGDGLRPYGEKIKENIKDATLAPEFLWHVRGSNIAELALRAEGVEIEPSNLAPVYLRKSEAELKRPPAVGQLTKR
jgi:tRNA threonylcarbamoyladenosine biosynthesis protein TsaB